MLAGVTARCSVLARGRRTASSRPRRATRSFEAQTAGAHFSAAAAGRRSCEPLLSLPSRCAGGSIRPPSKRPRRGCPLLVPFPRQRSTAVARVRAASACERAGRASSPDEVVLAPAWRYRDPGSACARRGASARSTTVLVPFPGPDGAVCGRPQVWAAPRRRARRRARVSLLAARASGGCPGVCAPPTRRPPQVGGPPGKTSSGRGSAPRAPALCASTAVRVPDRALVRGGTTVHAAGVGGSPAPRASRPPAPAPRARRYAPPPPHADGQRPCLSAARGKLLLRPRRPTAHARVYRGDLWDNARQAFSEPGETPAAPGYALARELKEELGIELVVPRPKAPCRTSTVDPTSGAGVVTGTTCSSCARARGEPVARRPRAAALGAGPPNARGSTG
jgi:hypothetical protein